jgi:predicted Zn-dependent peptidase
MECMMTFERMTRRALFVATLALAAQAQSGDFQLKLEQRKLSNGLTVLVAERDLPVVALAMVMPAGNMDSPPGMTGLPHMLEHMMFKGTQVIGTKSYAQEKPILDQMDSLEAEINAENAKPSPSAQRLAGLAKSMKELQAKHRQVVVKDELDQIYSRHGGRSLNAFTSQDVTAYHVLLPANQMPVYAALEQDRLAHPVFREFYSERDVVMQERREEESKPGNALWEALGGAAFLVHPYHNPTIGWMKDIKKLLRGDIEAFYKRAYRPDRGVLAVVGGVKADEVFKLLESTVGQVPNPDSAPLDTHYPVEPPQTKERRLEIQFQADPMADIGWHQPGFPDKDALALAVLADILTEGNSSRLVRRLVLKDKLAVSVDGGDAGLGNRAPALFVIQFTPAPGVSMDAVMAAMDDELAKVRKDGVTPEELARASRRVKASFLWAKDSPVGMALDLAEMQAVYGDWKVMDDFVNGVSKVDSAAVQAAAKRYLVDTNRTVAFLKKAEPISSKEAK